VTRIHPRLIVMLAVAVFVPCAAGGQVPAAHALDTASVATARIPVMAPLFQPGSGAPSSVAPRIVTVRRQLSQGQTLMIVGGAALVAGILVGDDAGTILILGGVAIGGYGLYLHLDRPNRR
jgi:hypothetical protein